MKKLTILLLVIFSFFSAINVNAKDKIFTLIDNHNNVRYDERKMKEEDFTKEMNLVTGKTFQDTHLITQIFCTNLDQALFHNQFD